MKALIPPTASRGLLVLAVAVAAAGLLAFAQPTSAVDAPESAAASQAEPVPDDLDLDKVEPDFTVINLPTTLRLPVHAAAFRVTHRFARPLGEGNFADLAADFFALDSGAQIGLELRFGLLPGTQLGLYRTSDRTMAFFAQQHLARQGASPVGLALAASVEGLDNFQEEFSPRVALVVSRRLGERAALYAVPAFVGNTRLGPDAPEADDSSFVLGLGARVQLGGGMAIVGEVTPRLAGFKGDRGGRSADNHVSFGFEKRVGGHSFQINFSNDLGTSPAQVARGQAGADGWFLGFNISRKFF